MVVIIPDMLDNKIQMLMIEEKHSFLNSLNQTKVCQVIKIFSVKRKNKMVQMEIIKKKINFWQLENFYQILEQIFILKCTRLHHYSIYHNYNISHNYHNLVQLFTVISILLRIIFMKVLQDQDLSLSAKKNLKELKNQQIKFLENIILNKDIQKRKARKIC